jgi:hypothetical protein
MITASHTREGGNPALTRLLPDFPMPFAGNDVLTCRVNIEEFFQVRLKNA